MRDEMRPKHRIHWQDFIDTALAAAVALPERDDLIARFSQGTNKAQKKVRKVVYAVCFYEHEQAISP